MSDTGPKPFTKAEMDAIRSATDDERLVRRSFWTKLKRMGGRVPFAEDLVAAYYCATDPTTPNRVRMILMAAIAYFIFPTDAITDLLPLIGFADDAAVLAAAISQVAGSITDKHRAHAKATLAGEYPAAHQA